jgi:chloramphenicol 3-O-phosphotransferase
MTAVLVQYLHVTATGDDDALERLRDELRAEQSSASIADSDLIWLGRNVDRIDVRLRDADGREHHVVATQDHTGLRVVLVLAEPDQVATQTPVVVVANGPSGSGKSTLLQSIAEVSETPWVTFDEPILGSTDQPLLLWPHRSPQLHAGFLDGIAAVAAAGNAVAVAAGGHAQARFRESMREVRALYIGLDCPTEVLVDREHGREGRWGGLAIQSSSAHDGWSYDLRIDTSELAPHEAARSVLALLT